MTTTAPTDEQLLAAALDTMAARARHDGRFWDAGILEATMMYLSRRGLPAAESPPPADKPKRGRPKASNGTPASVLDLTGVK